MKIERAITAVQFLCRVVIEDASGGVSRATVQEIREWLGATIGGAVEDDKQTAEDD